LTFFIFLYFFEKEVAKDKVGSVRVQQISNNLTRFGHKVILFIPQTKHPYKQSCPDVRIVEIPILPVWLLRPLSFYSLLFVVSFFQALCLRPDIIYVRIMGTFLPVILSKLLSIPLVIEVNGDSIGGYKNKLKIALLKITDRINFKFCNKAIPITKSLQVMLQQRYKVPFEKTAVIGSGSDTSLFKPMDIKECRRSLKLQADLYYVGFIGTLYEYQGIDTLIEAAPLILNGFANTKFLIVGEGPMKNAWIQKAAARNLSDHFIFTGQVPYEMVPYYVNAMDVCVAPLRGDRGDASPVKIFDYFACGKAVVASDIKSIHALLSESQGAIIVSADKPEQLSLAIQRLLGDEKKRYAFGRNGRNLVAGKYSWEKITLETVKVCEEVIKSQKPH